MAEDNLMGFTMSSITTGLLLFCLISFTILFMINNNPNGLGDVAQGKLTYTQSNLSGRLLSTDKDADKVLNITANTNPEASELGSRDSVSSSYSAFGASKGFFESTKILIAWVFVGEIGQMLLIVFGGIIGFLGFYFIYKFIKNGI
jgi:hypothetical protein